VSVVVYWAVIAIRGTPLTALAPWVIGLFILTGLAATSLARVGATHGGVAPARAGSEVTPSAFSWTVTPSASCRVSQ